MCGRRWSAAVVVCWAFVAAGLIAWRSDPSNPLGKLLTAVGFTWALGSLTDADASVPFTLGLATSAVTFGFLWHVLVAYPSGRLTSRFDRAVVVLAYLDTTVLRLPWLFTAEYPNDRCTDCPANALLIKDPSLSAGYELKLIDMDFSLLADRKAPWHGYQAYIGTDNYRSPEHLTRGGQRL